MITKKLGFGMMRLPRLNPDDAASIDFAQVNEMVDTFLARGFTYFDTAWMYCGFASEIAARECLVKRHPRGSFTLADKLHANYIKTEEDRDKIFSAQLEKTGVSYFDYYLLHAVNAEFYEVYTRLDCFSWLRAKKESGQVRHMGFSFHDKAELLDRILTEHPEVEFVQLQLNYLDWESESVQSRKCYETAVKHGKKVIVMEPVKGGTLAKVPESVERMFRSARPDLSVPSWAVRFAAGHDHVMMVLSGMSSTEQLLDNTGYMANFRPLDAEERHMVKRAADLINGAIAIPCTGCSYCTEGCPMHIAIPQYFSLYNADLQVAEGKNWKPQGDAYRSLAESFGRAGDCIACGQCEGACPQQLPVIRHLRTVASYFEQ